MLFRDPLYTERVLNPPRSCPIVVPLAWSNTLSIPCICLYFMPCFTWCLKMGPGPVQLTFEFSNKTYTHGPCSRINYDIRMSLISKAVRNYTEKERRILQKPRGPNWQHELQCQTAVSFALDGIECPPTSGHRSVQSRSQSPYFQTDCACWTKWCAVWIVLKK